jgi:hypothetical protein
MNGRVGYLKIDNIDDLRKEAKHEAYAILVQRIFATKRTGKPG